MSITICFVGLYLIPIDFIIILESFSLLFELFSYAWVCYYTVKWYHDLNAQLKFQLPWCIYCEMEQSTSSGAQSSVHTQLYLPRSVTNSWLYIRHAVHNKDNEVCGCADKPTRQFTEMVLDRGRWSKKMKLQQSKANWQFWEQNDRIYPNCGVKGVSVFRML